LAESAGAAASRADAERAARNMPRGRTQPASEDAAFADETWLETWKRRLVGEEGASYGVSLLVHLVILAIFAIPVIRHVTNQGALVAAIVEDSAGGSGSPFGLPDMINTELAPALPMSKPESPSMLPELDVAATDSLAVSKALLGTPDGKGGEGTGPGAGNGSGEIGNGMMQFVPKNAVRKGSFAAWTTPVYDDFYPRPFGAPDPKPGDSPAAMQNYWITIQIKVPGDRKRYPIRDLIGEVIGTDGYRQAIPKGMFQLSKDGKLKPLLEATQVEVVDGLVQFVVRVPGARRLVRDTIAVKSKLLKEEQELKIEFKGAEDREVTEKL
jgi:hypothetical protein